MDPNFHLVMTGDTHRATLAPKWFAPDSEARWAATEGADAASAPPTKAAHMRLSNKDRREMERLEKRIAALEAEQLELHATMEEPDFWTGDKAAIAAAQARLATLLQELETTYARWGELHG